MERAHEDVVGVLPVRHIERLAPESACLCLGAFRQGHEDRDILRQVDVAAQQLAIRIAPVDIDALAVFVHQHKKGHLFHGGKRTIEIGQDEVRIVERQLLALIGQPGEFGGFGYGVQLLDKRGFRCIHTNVDQFAAHSPDDFR